MFERGCRKSFAFNQLDYITDADDRIAVDFVGRFERIAEDFPLVCKNLGLDPALLGRANSTRHARYTTFYTPATRDLVAERFQRDIEAFDYRFGD